LPSSEKSKLSKLQIPKKGKYKHHGNNEDNNSNLSSKVSFWGSPVVSVGVENLFKLAKFHEDAGVLSSSQIKKTTCALYGALLSACHGCVGHRILIENWIESDGIWYQLVNQYETESNQNVMIKKLENVITTVFDRHLLEISFTFIQDLIYMFRVYPLGKLGI
jgi:hypothetical protein